MQGRKGLILSEAGTEVLINAVAPYLPTYVMSVFRLPSSFFDEIRSLISYLWWVQKQGERKIHSLAWKKICLPKNEGGLRFRDLKLFNWALLRKQVWRLYNHPQSLAAMMSKGKYFPNFSFDEAVFGDSPSYT